MKIASKRGIEIGVLLAAMVMLLAPIIPQHSMIVLVIGDNIALPSETQLYANGIYWKVTSDGINVWESHSSDGVHWSMQSFVMTGELTIVNRPSQVFPVIHVKKETSIGFATSPCQQGKLDSLLFVFVGYGLSTLMPPATGTCVNGISWTSN